MSRLVVKVGGAVAGATPALDLVSELAAAGHELVVVHGAGPQISEEMERFLEYLRNLAEENEGVLQPAYRINGDSDAEERVLEHLAGVNGDGPVRVGNQAFEHVQNDVYGEMVLGVSRLFLDARFVGEVPRHTAVDIMQVLVDQMHARLEEPDAEGSWSAEYRAWAVDDDTAVALGVSRYHGDDEREYHNVFLCRFDDDGRCREFTELYLRRTG